MTIKTFITSAEQRRNYRDNGIDKLAARAAYLADFRTRNPGASVYAVGSKYRAAALYKLRQRAA